MTKQHLDQILKIPGWLSENEGLLLYHFAKRIPENGVAVEIGSFCGKSTTFLALGLKGSYRNTKLYSIDPHESITHTGEKKGRDTSIALRKNLSYFGLAKYVEAIKSTSAVAAKKWQTKIDFLNIDGLHEYRFVKQDLRLWLPFLKDGGIVVCHDAFTPEKEVFRAVKEEIFDSAEFRYVGANDSQIFAVKGTAAGLFEKLNFSRSTFFLSLAAAIWQERVLPEWLRFVLVNRILKPFFMNVYMFRSMIRNLEITLGAD